MLILLLAVLCGAAAAQDSAKLLLTPQRVRRLQRDRERQTARWQNFEARLESVPDSNQRGFELALYYAVTRDENRGREAVQWVLAHECDPRQLALILNWCADLISDDDRRKLNSRGCASYTNGGRAAFESLQQGGFRDPARLYAACEYVLSVKSEHHEDPRNAAPQFFAQLPIEFLLSLRPEQVEHPDWMTHIAALALVAVDPNLEASQFVQAWAIEDRHMIRDGPGVAYEFLWADPYLPGVGYQNLEPWTYSEKGRLFARTTWDAQSCWIAISARGVEEQNCPAGWRDKPATFGHLSLIPMTERCVELTGLTPKQAAVLWRLNPGAIVFYHEEKQHSGRADPAGMFKLPPGAAGKVCLAR